MSFSGFTNNFNDDELFFADPNESRPEKSSNGTLFSKSFINQSAKSVHNCSSLAYFMMKSLILRLLYNRAKHIQSVKHRKLIKWRYQNPIIQEFQLHEHKFGAMILSISNQIKLIQKKSLMKWHNNSKILSIKSKYLTRRIRREEIHNEQIVQIKRVLSQLNLKKNDTEKSIKILGIREEKNKEILDELQKSGGIVNNENSKYEDYFRKLKIENENLKDRLEAVQNNICGFMQEMSGTLEADELLISDDDGIDDATLKSVRKKKLSLIK